MTTNGFDPAAAARFIAEAHERREAYTNLSGHLEPESFDDAYAVQEAPAVPAGPEDFRLPRIATEAGIITSAAADKPRISCTVGERQLQQRWGN